MPPQPVIYQTPPKEPWLDEYSLKLRTVTTVEAAIYERNRARTELGDLESGMRGEWDEEASEVTAAGITALSLHSRAVARLNLAERHLGRLRAASERAWAAECAMAPEVALRVAARDQAYELGLVSHEQFDAVRSSTGEPWFAPDDLGETTYLKINRRVALEGAVDRHKVPVVMDQAHARELTGAELPPEVFEPPVVLGITPPDIYATDPQCECGHQRTRHEAILYGDGAGGDADPCVIADCECLSFACADPVACDCELPSGPPRPMSASDVLDRGGRDV